ncbi:MAG TPA: hypothetical protein VER96_24575 [Polyangiaceae bacterium]|nr:hypothetical protein [Polyangiaceae bacterium]
MVRAQFAGISALALVVWLAGCGNSQFGDRGAAGASTAESGGAAGSGRAPGGGGAAVLAPGSGGATNADCRRDVSLTGVTLSEPEPFDLVIVADNSKSLAWSRDQLAAGLRDLLTNVKGGSVRVLLLTPTQYGADSAPARTPISGTPLVSWKDPATGQAYSPAVTMFEQSCTDPAGTSIVCPDPKGPAPYRVHGSWTFRAPTPIAVIRPDMTDTEFQNVQQAVADQILALGGTGSPSEQPLCTLARYVTQPASALPKNAVFLVISDEDDVSLPRDCLRGYDAELIATQQEDASRPCTSGCDVYSYSTKGTVHIAGRDTTCAAFTDTGKMIAGTERSTAFSGDTLASCDGYASRACTDAERTDATRSCNPGESIVNCQYRCETTEDVWCIVRVTDPKLNACTQAFTFDGQSYDNLPAYCAGRGIFGPYAACSGQGYYIDDLPTSAGGYTPIPLVAGTTTADLGEYFRRQSAAAFANGQSLLEGIVFAPSSSCQLGSGQSYARNLIDVIADSKRVFSLCDSYAPALSGVAEFARLLLRTDYTIELQVDEHVTGVVVVADDRTERSLDTSDYTFDAATGSLKIVRSALRATDASLRVEVTSDCRPVR